MTNPRGRAAGYLACLWITSLAATACERLDDTRPAPPDRLAARTPWQPTGPPDAVDLGTQRRDTTWWTAPTVDSVFRLDTLLRRPADRPFRPQPADSFRTAEAWDHLRDLALRPAAGDSTGGADPEEADSTASTEGSARGVEGTAGRTGEANAIAHELAEIAVPLGGDAEGPSVLYAQILLDRARFSPGVIDGRWGANTARAVLWFQKAVGLPPTSVVDSATLMALYDRADRPGALLVERRLSAADIEGPFVDIPADVQDQDSLDCLCYESVEEKLAELAHTTPELLHALNPEVALARVTAGETLTFPAVERPEAAVGSASGRATGATGDATSPEPTAQDSAGAADSAGIADSAGAADAGGPAARMEGDSAGRSSEIHRLVISDRGGYLHALDENGRILYHFPATLGSEYDPSPEGNYTVSSVTADPWFHFQPQLLSGVDDSEEDTHLPPGPNNPVGVVWMQLSIEHYGIHGSPAPELIGYTSSSGCIRLTNWDARWLSERIAPGVEVRFVDVSDLAG